jgi:hypothetical protein
LRPSSPNGSVILLMGSRAEGSTFAPVADWLRNLAKCHTVQQNMSARAVAESSLHSSLFEEHCNAAGRNQEPAGQAHRQGPFGQRRDGCFTHSVPSRGVIQPEGIA